MKATPLLCVSALLLLTITKTAASTASLMRGEILTGRDSRVSNNSVFRLGFFNLTYQTHAKWYLGIWYAADSSFIAAWVANRNNPLPDLSGAVLNLTQDGSLVLSRKGSRFWSPHGPSKPASAAVIRDNGNLEILGEANKSEVLWQSFEDPGNTWLPGIEIEQGQKLTAWKSMWDASEGPYSLEMDPAGANSFVLRWKNSVTYWDNGVWNNSTFSKVPEMNQNFIYDFDFFDNGSTKYFTYSVKPNFNLISRFELQHNGEIRVYSIPGGSFGHLDWNMFWKQPRTPCEVYAACGFYATCNNDNLQSCTCLPGFQPVDLYVWNSQDWSGGCDRTTPLACKSTQTASYGFELITVQSMPDNALVQVGVSDETACRDRCLRNCSCLAYSTHSDGTCFHSFTVLLNLREGRGDSSVYVRVNAKDISISGKKKKATLGGSVAGAVAGVMGLFGILLTCVVCRRRRAKSKTTKNSGIFARGSLQVYSYRDLQAATKNFSERLGGGGFGSVFKGALADGTLVAVKKLEGTTQGEKQFRTEVSTIGNIQHLNLVRLCGFCSEGQKRLLVYDFMPNGSLASLLFQEKALLDWKTRFGIAVGTARGIVYLHEQCRDCIIHCDIKPENILLDFEFRPKVADFGLAKLLGRDYSRVLTTMRGTRGYLAPEWLCGSPITAKADVYSFGMTLLEIISGRRNAVQSGDTNSGGAVFFPAWAAAEINVGNVMKVVDKRIQPEIEGEKEQEQLQRAVVMVVWCIQDDENMRPSMREVVQVLEGVGSVPPLPPIPLSMQSLLQQSPESLVFFWDPSSNANANSSSHSDGGSFRQLLVQC